MFHSYFIDFDLAECVSGCKSIVLSYSSYQVFLVDLTLYLLVSSARKSFANSLDTDQAGQNVRPDLDPSCLAL